MHIFYTYSLKQLGIPHYMASSASVMLFRLSPSPVFLNVILPDQGISEYATTGWPQHHLEHRHP